MNDEQIKRCHDLIVAYKKEKSKDKQEPIRNQIFEIMYPFFVRWVKAVLTKKGLFLEDPEILSYAWDCFLFALEHYKPHRQINVPQHCHSYTRFYILVAMSRKVRDNNTEELQPHDATYDWREVVHNIIDINSFRELVKRRNKGLLPVFDDAIMSLIPDNKGKVRRIPKGFGYQKYHQTKKVFKLIIEHLLKQGDA